MSDFRRDPRLAELAFGIRDWHLLFQVPVWHELGSNFIREGTTYFWVRDGDLKRSDFGKVWAQLQF